MVANGIDLNLSCQVGWKIIGQKVLILRAIDGVTEGSEIILGSKNAISDHSSMGVNNEEEKRKNSRKWRKVGNFQICYSSPHSPGEFLAGHKSTSVGLKLGNFRGQGSKSELEVNSTQIRWRQKPKPKEKQRRI